MKTSRLNSHRDIKQYIEEASDVGSSGEDFQHESFIATAPEGRFSFGADESALPAPIKKVVSTGFTRKFKKHIDGALVNDLSENPDLANSKNPTEHSPKGPTLEYIKADVKCQPREATSQKVKKPFVPRRSERLAQARLQRLKEPTRWPLVYDLPDGYARGTVLQENRQNVRNTKCQKKNDKKVIKKAETMKNMPAATPVVPEKSRHTAKKGTTSARKKAMEDSAVKRNKAGRKAHVQKLLKMIKFTLKKKISMSPLRMLPTKRIAGKQRVNLDDLAPAPAPRPARRYPSSDVRTSTIPMTRSKTRASKKLQQLPVLAKQELETYPMMNEQAPGQVVVIPDSQASSVVGPSWFNLSQHYTMQALTQYDQPRCPNSQAITVDSSQDLSNFKNTPAPSDIELTFGGCARKEASCQTLSLEHASRKSMMRGTNKKIQWNGANLPPLHWILEGRTQICPPKI
eukprot:GEMP01031831.1.p1 GENE.GEMP01031831.1~~GEMP01031831.1.p1  ORF type:complete len:458 (+),score=90.26 GEMP01031831.1:117-1490(+)